MGAVLHIDHAALALVGLPGGPSLGPGLVKQSVLDPLVLHGLLWCNALHRVPPYRRSREKERKSKKPDAHMRVDKEL